MSVALRVGDVLASKYRLEELLGSGGMGDVYRAVNVEIDRAVAIKVLRSEHATNGPIVERFLREARAANLVRHPNVVDVIDVGRHGDGSPFIVQELLQGADLAKYIAQRGGKLSLAEVEELLLPVIDAVAEAHAHGVVHRDIKPENVFLAAQGKRRVPKLLDFGISKVRLPNVKATEVGVMMGTPAYMAPEQVHGSRDADPRSDIWALGVVLFEVLAGRLPFDAVDAPALFVAIATKDVPSLVDVAPDVPPAVSRVVERCLRRAPTERYPTALELARDLRLVLEGVEPESTQKNVLAARPSAPRTMDVPDLVLPSTRSPAKPGQVPLGSSKTELAPAPSAPVGAASVRVHSAPTPPAPSAPSSARMAALAAPPAIMLGASVTTPRRPTANAYVPEPSQELTQDLSLVVGLAVVGLTLIGTTAVLMTFLHQPEGWPLLPLVTKPTASLNAIVQGGLALAATLLAGRSGFGALKKWRGELPGGRAVAVFHAVVGGGLFFAALQLAGAAW